MNSPAVEAVMAAAHPTPEDGGPCATCAFRSGTQANLAQHTQTLVALCVEGVRPFYCHEREQLCRGFVAAANLRGEPRGGRDRRYAEACGFAADVLQEAIDLAAEADRKASA